MTECQQNQLFCPLCGNAKSSLLATDPQPVLKHREYWQCEICKLIFVAPQFLLSASQEKAVYELHENNPSDDGYRRFLLPACNAVCEFVAPPALGLDFGAGPGPTLSLMLEAHGYACAIYDPYFAPNENVWAQPYDFITSTEVFEHLHSPQEELAKLLAHIKPNGILVIMTMLWREQCDFIHWSYKNDPTHIVFYSEDTFRWIASHFSLRLEKFAGNVVVLRKSIEN